MFCKILKFLFLILLIFFLFPPKALADDNFKTNYNIVYTLSDAPLTHVDINVFLVNKTTDFYASSYQILVGFSNIQNVVVMDENTPVNPQITKSGKGTQISINFANRVTGIGNVHPFTISFYTDEIAQNSGNIWEVNVPGIDKTSSIDQFNVSLDFPRNLGAFAYAKPNVADAQFNGNTISFNKTDVGNSGLSIAFGNYQVYDYSLTYHLDNPNVFPIIQQIALPPNTNYQDVEVSSISPKPSNVYQDSDGNWLASYQVAPSKKINIAAKGSIRVFLNPKKEVLSQAQFQNYLKPQQYWEVNDPKIQRLAKSLKTPQNIYNYVVNNLTYDFSRVKNNQQRLGAVGVLNDPTSAVCLEFTDLFIALSRAAGVPAREINGYAYTQNSQERPLSLVEDVLHAWPEYYDPQRQTWVMVDPTWENTTNGIDYYNTLDFDHVAFVIQGTSSTFPVPAGGYKTSADLNKKDVNVTLDKNFPDIVSSAEVDSAFDSSYVSGFPIEGSVRVFNNGNSSSDISSMIVSSSNLTPGVQNLKVMQIPPFGYLDIPVSYSATNFLTNRQESLKIQLGNTVFYQDFSIRPVFLNKWVYLLGGLIIAISIIGLLIYIRRSRRVSVQEQ